MCRRGDRKNELLPTPFLLNREIKIYSTLGDPTDCRESSPPHQYRHTRLLSRSKPESTDPNLGLDEKFSRDWKFYTDRRVSEGKDFLPLTSRKGTS